MIKIRPIEKAVELALWSAYLADEIPISILIAAQYEAGKTKLVSKYSENRGIVYLTDATAFGIWRKYARRIEAGEIKHFLFPDLLTPFSKQRETVAGFIAMLSNLTAEGIAEIQTAFLSVKLKAPVPLGIIACITKDELMDKRHRWSKMGFMSRMVPVSYDYSQETINAIFNHIIDGSYRYEPKINLDFPSDKTKVELPEEIAREARGITEVVKGEEYGFRKQDQIQRLIKAEALSRGSDVADETDLEVVRKLSNYFNLSYKKI